MSPSTQFVLKCLKCPQNIIYSYFYLNQKLINNHILYLMLCLFSLV